MALKKGLCCLLGLALFLAGCLTEPLDGDPPFTTRGLPASPQFSVGQDGSTALTVPSTNDGGASDSVVVATANKRDGILIEVTQSITSSYTTYCDPEVGTEGTFGPWGGGGGELAVSAIFNGSGMQSDPSDSGTSLKRFWQVAGSAGEVEVKRSAITGSCTGGPGLNLSGSTTIDYEIYPLGTVDADTAVVSSGDSVTFSAASHWTGWTQEGWRYKEWDVNSWPAGPGWPSNQVCTSSSTCDYAPPVSGRIYRVGKQWGSDEWYAGPIIWVGTPPAFVLEITGPAGGSVNRGDEVEFAVKNTGQGGELHGIALAWRFEPDAVQYYPKAGSPTFTPDTVFATGVDSVWSGPIVHPGKVIVTGTRDTVVVADTFAVSVAARSWDSPEVVLNTGETNSARPQDPTIADTTGFSGGRFHTVPRNDAWPDTLFYSNDHSTAEVTEGPNQGYHYVTSAAYMLPRAYSLTEWIDDPGSDYYGGETTWEWLVNASLDPSYFRDFTIDHEVDGGATSHLGRHNVGAASLDACGDLNAALERLVFGTSSSLSSAVADAKALSKTAILYASGHKFVYGHQSTPNPVARWWNKPGSKSGFLDIYDSSNGGFSAPLSTYCDVSGL